MAVALPRLCHPCQHQAVHRRKASLRRRWRIRRLRPRDHGATGAVGESGLKSETKLGLGLAAFVAAGLAWSTTRNDAHHASPAQVAEAAQARTRAKLIQLAPAKRRDIDYAALDARFRRLSPAVGGRLVGRDRRTGADHLSGGLWRDACRVEGAGHPRHRVPLGIGVEGLAATMVAKLAEQGKFSLDQPVAGLAPSLQLPNGAQSTATVVDLLSHRLGLYRNAFDNKLEEGQSAALLRRQLFTLSAVCAPGTCWNYQNVAYDAASEIVEKATGRRYADEVKRVLFDPIGMTSASVSRAGLQSSKSWARAHGVGRRPIEVNDIYYGVPGGRRHQQQHQGHVAVDAGADGADAAGAEPQIARDDLRAAGGDAARETAFAQVPRAAARPDVWARLAQLRLCRAPHRRPPRRGQRLPLADPVRPAAQERGGGAVEQQYQPARAGWSSKCSTCSTTCRSATGWSSIAAPPGRRRSRSRRATWGRAKRARVLNWQVRRRGSVRGRCCRRWSCRRFRPAAWWRCRARP